MCIRDRLDAARFLGGRMALHAASASAAVGTLAAEMGSTCLLYTSDAADERSSVDLGGRRIIQKKNYARLARAPTA